MSTAEKMFSVREVQTLTGLKPHVLRYWEKEFHLISPVRGSGRQRRYAKKDVEKILYVKDLLYRQKYTIAGAKKRIIAEQKAQEEVSSLPEFVRQVKRELKAVLKILE
ncbi:MAG: MerR family transcriptional regulator [bacterium]